MFVVVQEAEEGRLALAAGAWSVWAQQHKLPLSERCAVDVTPATLPMPAMRTSAAPQAFAAPLTVEPSPTTLLQVLPPGMSGAGLGPAPSGAIPNQGEWLGWQQAAQSWLPVPACCCGTLCMPHCDTSSHAVDTTPRGHHLQTRVFLVAYRAQRLPVRCCLACPFTGLHRVDTMGKLMSPTTMKRRGLQVSTRAPVWIPWLRLCVATPVWMDSAVGFLLERGGQQVPVSMLGFGGGGESWRCSHLRPWGLP